MSKGYIVLVQGKYVEQAELLAKSIRRTQSTVPNISIITDQTVDKSLFDEVIDFPQSPIEDESKWKIHNRVFCYDLSPYDETVMLDADMLFLTDVSHWWDNLSKHELLITNRVKNFRNEWINESANPYRQTFTSNNIPNLYSAFAYFKKSDKSKEFFDLLKNIISNWDAWSNIYTPIQRQVWPSIDVGMGIAAKILDHQDITASLDYPTFTHMKGRCQGYSTISDQWTNVLGYNLGDNYIRIGSHIQQGILHYVEKDFARGPARELFK